MSSFGEAHALGNQFDETEEEPQRAKLVLVEAPPRPFEDPFFRYVILGFVSFFMILGVAAYLAV